MTISVYFPCCGEEAETPVTVLFPGQTLICPACSTEFRVEFDLAWEPEESEYPLGEASDVLEELEDDEDNEGENRLWDEICDAFVNPRFYDGKTTLGESDEME